jgi:hypothetical protein
LTHSPLKLNMPAMNAASMVEKKSKGVNATSSRIRSGIYSA